MRSLLLIASLLLVSSCDKMSSKKTSGTSSSNVELKTLDQKISYVFGQQIGREMKNQGVDIDIGILTSSINDAMEGKEPRMKQADMQKAMREMQAKIREKRKKEGEENKAKGKAFLDANKAKDGVKTTSSGLQYKVLTEGKGAKPKETDKVRVHYKGTLIDGKEFDSSYKRGQPAEFPLNRVIKGWTEGLQLMTEGSKYQFYIPSDLAYGPTARPSIPANSVLVFDVELLAIVKEEKKKEAGK